MKTRLVAAALLACPLIATAQSESGGYIRLGAGLSLVEDIEGYSADFAATTNFELTLDPGLRFDVAPGYNFNRYVGLEFNTGVVWNTVDSIEVEDGRSISVDGTLWQIPFLANVILRYPTDIQLTPFVGAGGGGLLMGITVDNTDDIEVYDRADDIFAAYQLFGGLQYEITESLSLGLVYKYLHLFSEQEDPYDTAGLGDITTHSFSAMVSFDF
jgi:opacity protein-like surface antigen